LALTPKDNEAFFREVDEELRRAQVTGFARRWGMIVAVAILLLLAGVGAFLWWQNRQEVRAGEQAEEMTAILDDVEAGRTKGLDARLDSMAEKGTDGYRAAALLTKADLAIQAQKESEAIALFKKIAEDEDLARPYRDLALVRQTALEFDKLAPAVVIERLKPLAVKGNPWFGSAGEMVAIAYMKQQKPELAGRLFADMSKDEKVPRSIQSRATAMAGALGVDAVQDVPAAKEAAGTKEGSQ
jgi:hypothetical protein